MAVLDFDKSSLTNLEYSLQREMLSTDRKGGYMSTTIVCCNTRKYHGLMVTPLKEIGDDKNYVLLSSLDETIIQHEQPFNLAIHRFPGLYEPRGHKYITDFRYTPTPTIIYRVGGAVLKKEMMWIHSRTQLLIRYTLLEAASPTVLRLRPFLAFRDAHTVTSANMFANGQSYAVKSGVRCRMYEQFPWLHMQVDKSNDFIAAPDWHCNFEYLEEQKRGYPFREDLLTPGYFELPIKRGESVIFNCSLVEVEPKELAKEFSNEMAKRSAKVDFLSCMRHSARQFVIRRGGRTEVVAGYPWFGRWGRDTFIALPGITLSQGDVKSCMDVMDTMTSEMQNGMFPNMGTAYNSVDAPLWFFWTLQQLESHIGREQVWSRYGQAMKEVLNGYRNGSEYVSVHDNGLIWASHPTLAMTWMDAVVDNRPVTGRDGYQVEINALWFNAISYTLRLAVEFEDIAFAEHWRDMPERIRGSFLEKFWYADEEYLADYVDGQGQNLDIRPNQILACAFNYSMLSEGEIISVIRTVRQHLLTPKGLRTLTPHSPMYEGRYGGDQPTRDRQYHQGTVWPWLLEHYVAANFRAYGEDFLQKAEEILLNFEDDLTLYGIGSTAEIYDGDPPHHPNGTPSQAWSVGSVLRIHQMIEHHRQGGKFFDKMLPYEYKPTEIEQDEEEEVVLRKM